MNTQSTQSAWLHGGDTPCFALPTCTMHAYRLVLLGPPGAGKDTQAGLLATALGACHLSTRNVFLDANCSTAGYMGHSMKDALAHLGRGESIPDALIIGMMRERARCLRCRGGFLLNGFPRSVPQATALLDMLRLADAPLDAAILYNAPIDICFARLAGRRVCSSCRRVYNIDTHPSIFQNVCSGCGGDLIQRAEDNADGARIRMDRYERRMKPVIEFFRQRRLLLEVDAAGTPDQICPQTLRQLNGSFRALFASSF